MQHSLCARTMQLEEKQNEKMVEGKERHGDKKRRGEGRNGGTEGRQTEHGIYSKQVAMQPGKQREYSEFCSSTQNEPTNQ